MTGTQIFISPAAGTPLSGKTGTRKTDSAESADFIGILMSMIAGSDVSKAQAAFDSVSDADGFRGDTNPGETAADESEQSGGLPDSAASQNGMPFIMPRYAGVQSDASGTGPSAKLDTGGSALRSNATQIRAPDGNAQATDGKANTLERAQYGSRDMPETSGFGNSMVNSRGISQAAAGGQAAQTDKQEPPDTTPEIVGLVPETDSEDVGLNRRGISEGGKAKQSSKTEERDLPDTGEPEPPYAAQAYLAAAELGSIKSAADADGGGDSSVQRKAVGFSSVRPAAGNRESVSDIIDRELKAVEFTHDRKGSQTVSDGDTGESYGLFADVIDSYYIDARPAAVKKPAVKSDRQSMSPVTGGAVKADTVQIQNAMRFQTRRIEYAEVSAKETDAVQRGAQRSPEIYTQLSGAVKTAAEKSDVSVFKLKLKPEGLGEVTVKLSRSRDRIDVELSAELASTKKLIEGELENLRVSLNDVAEAKEYRFGSVTVESQPYGMSTDTTGGQHSRGGSSADYGAADFGKRETGYRAAQAAEDKAIGAKVIRYGNRLIDCIA